MSDATTNADALPRATDQDVLTEVLRQGAAQLLAQAIQARSLPTRKPVATCATAQAASRLHDI
jgi:hypothetical protein